MEINRRKHNAKKYYILAVVKENLLPNAICSQLGMQIKNEKPNSQSDRSIHQTPGAFKTAWEQDYCGSNNMNLLEPIGQFGTRLSVCVPHFSFHVAIVAFQILRQEAPKIFPLTLCLSPQGGFFSDIFDTGSTKIQHTVPDNSFFLILAMPFVSSRRRRGLLPKIMRFFALCNPLGGGDNVMLWWCIICAPIF